MKPIELIKTLKLSTKTGSVQTKIIIYFLFIYLILFNFIIIIIILKHEYINAEWNKLTNLNSKTNKGESKGQYSWFSNGLWKLNLTKDDQSDKPKP